MRISTGATFPLDRCSRSKNKDMGTFWDERFAAEEYVYGKAPNTFFAQYIESRPPGRLLLPMEGEGRNAVYAARMGWEVDAFDASVEGIRKARNLAQREGIGFNYLHHRVEDFPWPKERYDLVALVFAHLPADIRPGIHQKVSESLKPGGQLFVELFHPDQLGRSSGGPIVADMLYSPELLTADFPDIEFQQLDRVETKLAEGRYHQGEAVVTRGFGKKLGAPKQ